MMADDKNIAAMLLASMSEERKQVAEDRRLERLQVKEERLQAIEEHKQAMQFLQMQLVQRGEEQAQREVAHRIEMKELSE